MEHTENKKQESMDNNQIAMKVSAVSIAINLILSVLKLIACIGCGKHTDRDRGSTSFRKTVRSGAPIWT